MTVNLPSIMSLRALEAASRHGSLTKAATELHITQSAVSHQIRGLEATLGVQLLVRDRAGLVLTDIGCEYVEQISRALLLLTEATERVSCSDDTHLIKVACFSVFATKCLIPQLEQFRKVHSDIDVRVESFNVYDDFARREYDAAICYGNGDWGKMTAQRVTSEEAFPVCSPRLLTSLKKPRDLRNHTIIRTKSTHVADCWPDWLTAADAEKVVPHGEVRCDMLSTAIQAAIDGLGVAMVRRSIVQSDLRNGTLVEPFDLRIPTGEGYFLLTWPGKIEKRKARLFSRWILGEFRESLEYPLIKRPARSGGAIPFVARAKVPA